MGKGLFPFGGAACAYKQFDVIEHTKSPHHKTITRECRREVPYTVPHGQVCKGADGCCVFLLASELQKQAMLRLLEQLSPTWAVVLPHFTELVTLPVFAGDAPGCSQIMNDHKKGFPCLLVCAFVLVLLRSVTFIVGGKTPPLKHTKPAQRYMQFSFYQTL